MELLAPAGNFECLTAAVQNGANAVYFSGKAFGARSYADNFDYAELEHAVDYCHLRNCKAYITVNTLILDKEFKELEDYLRFLSKVGVDAVIVQDLGAVSLIREVYPELPVHASTQMSVHNAAGVKELEKIGVKRVVLARELSKDNITEIVNTTAIEIEVFVHGAMCMSYSGQCLMSSLLGGRSGNRGKCAQPCRLPYRINNEQDAKFNLSLKDMSLLNHLAELQNIGVTSLKLEGRMKGAAYVAAVVQTYRRCLDSGTSPTEEELRILRSVFFRGGYSNGYFTGQTGREMFTFNKPDNPYQKENSETNKELLKSFNNVENIRHKLKGHMIVSPGQCPTIRWDCEGISVVYTGTEKVQMAQQRSLTQEAVLAQMLKTGGTVFEITEFTTDISSNCFLPVRTLNEIRRESLHCLEEKMISSYKREVTRTNNNIQRIFSRDSYVLSTEKREKEYRCSVLSIEQFRTAQEFPFNYIGVPLSMAIKYHTELLQQKERIILIPPAILREDEWKKCCNDLQMMWQAGFRALYIHNISMVNIEIPFRKYGSFRLNIFNQRSAEFFLENGCESITLSPELNLSQIRDIAGKFHCECIVYGHLPLMITENCIIRNQKTCLCEGENYITDRLGISFPVVKDDDICRSVILNAKPIYMADKYEDLRRSHIRCRHLMFTTENKLECAAVCSDYFSECGNALTEQFTRAHFYKGV